MHPKRLQRALDKAERFIERLSQLRRDLSSPSPSDGAHETALLELESLVLVSRGSSETDHRTQLVLVGVQAAFEAYLAPAAPRASEYAAAADKDALLANEALRELRDEYPDDAHAFHVAAVATAVRSWAETYPGAMR